MSDTAHSERILATRYSLHHLLDPAAAFREMVRVCASARLAAGLSSSMLTRPRIRSSRLPFTV
jgi:ubiquinone/menaquinone biosynthesis C-methylase UbiE